MGRVDLEETDRSHAAQGRVRGLLLECGKHGICLPYLPSQILVLALHFLQSEAQVLSLAFKVLHTQTPTYLPTGRAIGTSHNLSSAQFLHKINLISSSILRKNQFAQDDTAGK